MSSGGLLEDDGPTGVGQIVGNHVQDHVQVLILMIGAHNANFALCSPRIKFAEVVNDDGD